MFFTIIEIGAYAPIINIYLEPIPSFKTNGQVAERE